MDVHPDQPEQLRFVLAPSPTLASSTLLQVGAPGHVTPAAAVRQRVTDPSPWFPQADERRSHVEVCAEGGVLIQQLAGRIAEHRGAALIADYGHDGTETDTFRVRRSGHQ